MYFQDGGDVPEHYPDVILEIVEDVPTASLDE